jgi:hypothetical protein
LAVRRPAAPPVFQPKEPEGTIDETKLTEIIAAIDRCGLHLDRAKAVEHGKARFAGLLAGGRELRKVIHLKVELTSFGQLTNWLPTLFKSPLPPLDLGQQLRGERFPQAALIRGLDDIWKAVPDPLVNQLYGHWTLFKTLVFGQSLLDAADSEHRVRSPLWAGGLLSSG